MDGKQQDWRRLRSQYPTFRYERFTIEASGSALRLLFRFRIGPEIQFNPEIIIESDLGLPFELPSEVLDTFAFNLGLAEMLSYWKATCSQEIVVEPASLDHVQCAWWKDLILHGFGEFFYLNQIDFRDSNFVHIRPTGTRDLKIFSEKLSPKSLVPIGGGRDSAVAGMILSRRQFPLGCLMLNPTPAATAVAKELHPLETITVRRTIDPELLRLNSAGYLNGHVPFSAHLAFLSSLIAIVFNYRNIVLANEHSANEGNTEYLGYSINHQYSKSIRFEELFDSYVQRYLAAEMRYFSFMRPFSELQIGRAFAQLPSLFGSVKSCNHNIDTLDWCGRCAKCLSVFITTYPFVGYADIIRIFGRDFFEDAAVVPTLLGLAGEDGPKPFECVCTVTEALVALRLCVETCRNSGRVIPDALRIAALQIPMSKARLEDDSREILQRFAENRIPPDFANISSDMSLV